MSLFRKLKWKRKSKRNAVGTDQSAIDWHILNLIVDESSEELADYFSKIFLNRKVEFRKKIQGVYDTLWERSLIEHALVTAVGEEKKKTLAVYGSGYYHHYTYGLCRAADRLSDDYCYIHIDNHSDDCSPLDKRLDCSSFVDAILSDTAAKRAVFIGGSDFLVKGKYVKRKSQITNQELEGDGLSKLERVLAGAPHDVYLSFDLDVMEPSEIVTNYSRGKLSAKELFQIIDVIKQTKHIISADILGYCGRKHEKSLRLYENIAAMVIKQI